MENPEKQLAVEWFNQQLVDRQNGNGDSRSRDEIFEQAKVMEEDGRHASYLYGHKVGYIKAKEMEEEEKKNNQSKSSEPYLEALKKILFQTNKPK
jgi:hypothetical protein